MGKLLGSVEHSHPSSPSVAVVPIMPLGPLETKLLRGWLFFLTVFEFPNLHGYLIKNTPMNGFFSTMKNARPEKRAWSMVLALLCFARLQAVFFTNSGGVLTHNAAVHVLEAVVFGYEKFKHNSAGGDAVYSIIVANAVWFVSAAMRQ